MKSESEYNFLSTFEEYKLSDTIPQLAEVREVHGYELPHFPVSKYIVNKPMQKLLGISEEDDAVPSLNLGVKHLRFLSQHDSVQFLQRYFQNYANHIRSRFKNASEYCDVIKITRYAGDGNVNFLNFRTEQKPHNF